MYSKLCGDFSPELPVNFRSATNGSNVIVCHEPGEAWGQFKVRAHGGATVFRTFPEAMDAARALAVGE